MLDGLMAQNVVGLAFGGGAKDLSKTGKTISAPSNVSLR